MKIVSLLPSATELVYALGLGDQLEGVTFECDYPPEARTKPVVSDTALPTDRPRTARETDDLVTAFMDRREPLYVLDKELISKIQPDLILTQDLCRVCAVPSGQIEDALDELGCSSEVVSMDPNGLEDILESFMEVGRATGTETRAKELVEELRERIDQVRARAVRLPEIRTFCLEWLDPPFAGGHWIPEMVELAAGRNLLSTAREPSRQVTWRQVADASPEVVVFMPCGYYLEEAEDEGARIYDVPEFRETTARAEGTVYATDASSYFSRPGPRIVDGLDILAWAIHPDVYPQPEPGTITRLPAPA
ncbi:MAG TPA: cobalamin-binding protein [Actinomycetota bacterium]|nr:cobalamin-binding protein [Actinomycetota bacterium]